MTEKITSPEAEYPDDGLGEEYWAEYEENLAKYHSGERTYGQTHQSPNNAGGGFPLPGYERERLGYDDYGKPITPLRGTAWHTEPDQTG